MNTAEELVVLFVLAMKEQWMEEINRADPRVEGVSSDRVSCFIRHNTLNYLTNKDNTIGAKHLFHKRPIIRCFCTDPNA